MSFAIVARSIRGVSVGAVALVCSLSAVSASAEGKHDRNEGLDSIEHEAFSIELKPSSAAVGQVASVSVSVKAKGGFHLNQDYPHKLKLEDVPAGVRVEKTELRRADAELDERQLTFKLVATPEKAGRHTIHAVLKTSVCDDKQCILKSEKLTLHVVAK